MCGHELDIYRKKIQLLVDYLKILAANGDKKAEELIKEIIKIQ